MTTAVRGVWCSFDYARSIVFFLILILAVGCHPALQRTKRQIKKELRHQDGTFAVAFQNVNTGETILFHEHRVFHAASTMKTPVLIEVFQQASQGKFSLNDSVVIKNEFKSIVDSSAYALNPEGDSEKELYALVGQKTTIYNLAYRMITASSNLATNNLIERVGAKNVTQSMRDLGAGEIQVLRGVEDAKAFDKHLNNVTSAQDLMTIFYQLALKKLVSEKDSEAMTQILLDQKFNEIIPANLPGGIKVAHKTGSLAGIRHDAGIVLIPDGRKYVLVILSKDLTDEQAATKAMANVSYIVYRFVISMP